MDTLEKMEMEVYGELRIAPWIDSLGDPRARDAIIQHRDPTYDGEMWRSSARDCGCLVGGVCHALSDGRAHNPDDLVLLGLLNEERFLLWWNAGLAFPDLTHHFGPEAAWAAAKERAAQPYRITLPEQVEVAR